MFDQLFRRRAAVRRHLNSPLSQERLDYLQYCANVSAGLPCGRMATLHTAS
jgi:hypothetical protein